MKRLSLLLGVSAYVLTMGVLSAQQPQGQAQGQAPAAQGQAPAAQGQGDGRQGGGRAGGGAGAPAGGAQAGRAGGRGQAPPTNLQVLPRTTTAAEIGPIMQAFTASLGVQCNYCH